MDEPTCSVTGDTHGKPGPIRLGMCGKHYTRYLKYGDPLVRRNRTDSTTPEQRFWVKVNKDGPLPEQRPELGPCWVWTAATQGSGYGHFRLDGKSVGAHVAAYAFTKEAVPEGMDLDHLCHPGDGSCPRATCRHKLCVNPDHLEPTSRLENLRRGNTFIAAQLAVTHCPQGHEYTEENTRVRIARSGNEMRSCRQCDRERRERETSGRKRGWRNAAKTHCPYGHEYTPENTMFDPGGGTRGARRCRTCRRERSKKTDKTA